MVHVYDSEVGAAGYQAGDVVVERHTGAVSVALADGHGVSLERCAVYRGHCPLAQWYGPVRTTAAAARADVHVRRRSILARGGIDRGLVITTDPEAPLRSVDADTGAPVWPTHGRSCGSVWFWGGVL